MTDAATHAEAVLAMWLSGVAVALVIVLAAIYCHDRREWRAEITLLKHELALPQVRQEVDSWTERVRQPTPACGNGDDAGAAREREAQNRSEVR